MTLRRILLGLVSFVLIDLTIALAIFGFAIVSIGFIGMKCEIMMRLLFDSGVTDFVFSVVIIGIEFVFFFRHTHYMTSTPAAGGRCP